MAGDPTARRAGGASVRRRIGQSHPPAGPEIPREAGRRRRGTRRADRYNLWRWSALRRCAARLIRRVWAPRRERAVRLSLPPITAAADIAAMLGAITTAVGRGGITPAEAASLAEVADAYVRALETSEFDRRLRALETAHAATP